MTDLEYDEFLDTIDKPKIDWKNYNRDVEQIIINEYDRRETIQQILEDTQNPEKSHELMRIWKNNPVAFINDCTFTYDPRRMGAKKIPFLMFPRQEEYITFLQNCYLDRADGLIEKCRDVGLSWLNCAFSVWLYLFQYSVAIGWGANKLELVDRLGDMNSLLERMHFIIMNLPPTMKPQHERRFTKLLNHSTGSSIVGSGGSNAGRGGRSSIFFLDESAFIEGASKVEASLSMNTDCQIWLSTPNGMNLFYRKRMGGHFRIFTFHWYQDVRKDQKWYDAQEAKLDPATFAQEVLIDYSGSVENQVIQPEWINSALAIKIEPQGSKVLGFDIADEGADKNAMVARYGSVVTHLDHWSGKGLSITHSAGRVWNWAIENNYEHINYDAFGLGAEAKTAFKSIRAKDKFARIAVSPIMAKALTGTFQKTGRKKVDMFLNHRALAWWSIRMRFLKTHEHYTKVQEHNLDDLISLDKTDPLIDQLMSELVSPTYMMNENGKIQIEKKESMKKRGVKSPNIADALVYAYDPIGFDLKALLKR